MHSLSIGGAEILAARIGRRLRDRFRFVFACLDELGPLGDELAAEGFDVRHVGRRSGLDRSCIGRLRGLFREIDLIHAHQYTPFFYATAARVPFGRPVILFTEHGRFHPDYPRRKRMLYNRIALGRRDRVVAVGEAVRQALIANEGIRASRVEVIPNGIDLAPYIQPDARCRTSVRQEFGLSDATFVVAQVARLDPIKDHPTAVRVVARLVELGIDAHLLVVGDGSQRPVIEAEIGIAGVGNQVTMAGTRRDVSRLLAAADAFLLTSVSEGIPLTVIEAMAAGLPVVCTDVGGLSEIVTPGETGLLAHAGEHVTLADHLSRLAKDRQLRSRLGRAGRDVAFSRFSENAMLDAYASRFESMTASRSSARAEPRA